MQEGINMHTYTQVDLGKGKSIVDRLEQDVSRARGPVGANQGRLLCAVPQSFLPRACIAFKIKAQVIKMLFWKIRMTWGKTITC